MIHSSSVSLFSPRIPSVGVRCVLYTADRPGQRQAKVSAGKKKVVVACFGFLGAGDKSPARERNTFHYYYSITTTYFIPVSYLSLPCTDQVLEPKPPVSCSRHSCRHPSGEVILILQFIASFRELKGRLLHNKSAKLQRHNIDVPYWTMIDSSARVVFLFR